jgi:hypothetical protein
LGRFNAQPAPKPMASPPAAKPMGSHGIGVVRGADDGCKLVVDSVGGLLGDDVVAGNAAAWTARTTGPFPESMIRGGAFAARAAAINESRKSVSDAACA